MRRNRGWFDYASWCLGLTSAAAAVFVFAGFLLIGFARPAQALPSYARQTGQPCGTCHTDFAGLTPYGRLFKLGVHRGRRPVPADTLPRLRVQQWKVHSATASEKPT